VTAAADPTSADHGRGAAPGVLTTHSGQWTAAALVGAPIPREILLDISAHSSRMNPTGKQRRRLSECRRFSGFSPVFAGLFRLALGNYPIFSEIMIDIAEETPHISFVTGY
jgi:hypothetical protein